MKEKYINLFTDFGFKKIFGEEANKEHLIAFLNTLLPERHKIETLQFAKNEQLGVSTVDRRAIFDLHCTSQSGEYFIVELQKAKQNYFKDRSVFYATFPIQQQAERGEWNFKLAAVYTIGILDFLFDEDDGNGEVVHTVKLKNQNNEIFYDKLTFIYLTLPNFTKTENELESDQEKWFFLFRYLHELDEIPPRLRSRIYESIFEKAQIARMNPAERQSYEDSLKYYRDIKNVVDTARDEGLQEGREEGIGIGREEGRHEGMLLGRRLAIFQTIRKLVGRNSPLETIADVVDLPVDNVRQIIEAGDAGIDFIEIDESLL
ncbi:Rpn family recombination-promoting nuclease/putative transposase [Chrysiogenes arsenatis]|uniref:Rpn family recombination-promoting nuclease/putative transposase n=1 Tax=Chrysiogenes arsenatis TaxID=309797 RepID=UPI000423B728|nr:Rpn family recombination-promoting nuclease/putative transposase [Chrysiogenes arsenatis]